MSGTAFGGAGQCFTESKNGLRCCAGEKQVQKEFELGGAYDHYFSCDGHSAFGSLRSVRDVGEQQSTKRAEWFAGYCEYREARESHGSGGLAECRRDSVAADAGADRNISSRPGHCRMIAAPVQCDANGIPTLSVSGTWSNQAKIANHRNACTETSCSISLLATSGPLVPGHTDNAARRSCPISLLRNVGSSYSEEPWGGGFVPWQSSFMD